MIPQDQIEQVKERVDIVSIISEYVSLKASGTNFKGLCPFHSEKTPSFMVSPDKQIFHCFGCSVGGNVFTFLMKFQGLSFIEVVEKLAPKAGVTLKKQENAHHSKEVSQKKSLLKLNGLAALFYHNELMTSKSAEKARVYFKKRQISDETIIKFKLGYAPDAWEMLKNHLTKLKAPLALMVEGGLVTGKNKIYDYFRNRVIFPILDVEGEVIGFGARALDADQNPKYLNSKDSLVYSKSRSLYGIQHSKSHILKEGVVYIVEGYFDALALMGHGINNVVAPLGTALTEEQIRFLKRYTKQIVLIFDSDVAGINAMKRTLKLLLQEEVDAQVVILPKGKDPDEFVNEVGKEKFLEFVKSAQDKVFFLLQSLIQEHGTSIQGKIKVLEELMPQLVPIVNPMEKSLYINEISQALSIEESKIYGFLKSGSGAVRKGEAKKDSGGLKKEVKFDKAEKYLVLAILKEEQWISVIEALDVLDLFEHEELEEIATQSLEVFREKGKVDIAEVMMKSSYPALLTRLSFEAQDLDFNRKIIDDCCKNIRMRYMKKMQRELLEKLKKEENPEILSTYQRLVSELKKLAGGNERA